MAPSTTIFVDNLPPRWASDDLRKFFEPLCLVVDSYVVVKRSKRNSRFGFVRIPFLEDVDALVLKFNGTKLDNKRLFVAKAKFERGGALSSAPSVFAPPKASNPLEFKSSDELVDDWFFRCAVAALHKAGRSCSVDVVRLWVNAMLPFFKDMWMSLLHSAISCPSSLLVSTPPGAAASSPPPSPAYFEADLVVKRASVLAEAISVCQAEDTSVVVDAHPPRSVVDAVGLDVLSEAVLEAEVVVGEAVVQVVADAVVEGLDVISEAVVEVQVDAVAQRPVDPMDAWLAEYVVTSDGRPLDVASLAQPWVGTHDPLVPTPTRFSCRKRRLTEKAASRVKLPLRKAIVKMPTTSPSSSCLGSIINDLDGLDVELCSVLTTEAWRLAIVAGFSWEEDTSQILHAIKLAARGQFSPWNFDPP